MPPKCENQKDILIILDDHIQRKYNGTSRWAHDAITSSSLRPNDVGGRNKDVIIASLLRHVSVGIVLHFPIGLFSPCFVKTFLQYHGERYFML